MNEKYRSRGATLAIGGGEGGEGEGGGGGELLSYAAAVCCLYLEQCSDVCTKRRKSGTECPVTRRASRTIQKKKVERVGGEY